MQDLNGSSAQQLLRAEAAAEQAFFAGTEALEQRLQAEAAHLLRPEAQAEPEVHGPFRYFQRYGPEGFVIFCREPLEGGAAEVLLDTGELARAAGTGFADVTACKVSDDHAVLAYIVDTVGDESYELRFMSLGPGGFSWPARVPGVRSVEFMGRCPGQTGVDVLTVHMDPQTRRACRISRMSARQDAVDPLEEDVLWVEPNEAAYLEVFRTKDKRCVLLSSNTKDTSEVRVVRCAAMASDADVPVGPLGLLAPREGVEYFAEHCGDSFYIISNHERPDFSVYQLPDAMVGAEDGGWQHLRPFFTPPGGLHVTDADMLQRWLVLYGHEAAGPRVCVVPVPPGGGAELPAEEAPPAEEAYLAALPHGVGSVEPGVNADPEARRIRFTFRSPLEPGATYDLQLDTGEVQLVSRREWAHGLDPDAFVCERIEYPARDGEMVPLTVARPKWDYSGGSAGAPRPCLLHVYGAYGTCLVPDFRPEHALLLRRGWTLAWAHVRGGGERGRAWHAAGRRLRKARSVEDLADASRFLLARGLAAPGALCLKAASAGGLTLGALLNAPSQAALVGAAVLEVPFVDVLTGMLDPTLPLTVHEFAEWGDPREEPHEANLRSLSPYENVGSHRYPPMYLSCAREDSRVPPWMPLKLAARVRARAPAYLDAAGGFGARRRQRSQARAASKSGEAGAPPPEEPQVVLRCADGGHGGAADWHGRTEEFARQIVFLYKALGLAME